MKHRILLILSVFLIAACGKESAESDQSESEARLWHNKEREIRYRPSGDDFVIINGSLRFNRALYGTHTAFRVETGDLPEFSMYMPGMGGNLKFALIAGDSGKWLIDAEYIEARYRPGAMIYRIKDPILGEGQLELTVLAMADAEGMILRAVTAEVDAPVDLLWAYGGVSGERFSRNGDIGADPESSFYLKPENCAGNEFSLEENTFSVRYAQGSRHGERSMSGVFPSEATLRLADANQLEDPVAYFESQAEAYPALAGRVSAENGKELYFSLFNPETREDFEYDQLDEFFAAAEKSRKELAGRVRVNTPDPYLNTLGGALSVAADAIWEEPTYLHGAVAWRMRLAGWRGANVADPLGWSDRARMHFAAYEKSQLKEPPSGPNVPDPKVNWARQKEEFGVSLFTRGYITRHPGGVSVPHHYDMNLVFFDQMLSHFNWTGDTAFVRDMWPAIQRHLAWEKRCFDGNGDGLYDAYCCIWASDAVQYSGGGVTHSSSYNYRSNKLAAQLAGIMGEDPEPYRKEAQKIRHALNNELWLPQKGWYGEYKDLLGLQRVHEQPAVWTIYHAIDSEVPDLFQAYQALNYIDHEIPHIPIRAQGLDDERLFTISTSNWMPYTWSVNNVALAEALHTSLAYWQAGRNEDAFGLWRSALIESMYLGMSPGGFQQLSFYDAMRGELYRDFADPIGVAGRTLVEGLFGVSPDLLNERLLVAPGFPSEWEYASLETPNMQFDFRRRDDKDVYTIKPLFGKSASLRFTVYARSESVDWVTVNGKRVEWEGVEDAVGKPQLAVETQPGSEFVIEIAWKGAPLVEGNYQPAYARGAPLSAVFHNVRIHELYDPQQSLDSAKINGDRISGTVNGLNGLRTFFARIEQGDFTWWEPVKFEVKDPVEIAYELEQPANALQLKITNHTAKAVNGRLLVNPGKNQFEKEVAINAGASSGIIEIPDNHLMPGTALARLEWDDGVREKRAANWNLKSSGAVSFEQIDLNAHFNDRVSNIFKNRYETPRSPYPTLQLPLHGIGNWAYGTLDIPIDDSGLRRLAGAANEFTLPQGIPFSTPGRAESNNIAFTSLWDNYPDSLEIPLSGSASHGYFLMAGTTNPMQSRFENGAILIEYTDGTTEELSLRNPESWHPIEQDFYRDGFAFSIDAPRPVRVHLKTGWIGTDFKDHISIRGFTDYGIEGGAATVLDLPLNPEKELKRMILKSTANDVVIGLMSVTLVRE